MPQKKGVSRELHNFPFLKQTIKKRLKSSGAINLVDNHKVVYHPNGYSEVKPIDIKKLIK